MPPDSDERRLPTIADVARRAGVAKATASRALNQSGHVKASTRIRVVKVAEQLGYQINPALASRSASRYRARPENQLTTIAILTRSKEPLPLSEDDRRVGLRHGFDLEVVNTFEWPDARRLSRNLRQRGVGGVLLHRVVYGAEYFIEFDWSPFAVVSLDQGFQVVPVPIVRTAQTSQVLIACRHMRALGYRRIGLAAPWMSEFRIENFRRTAGMRMFEHLIPIEDTVPWFLFEWQVPREELQRQFTRYYRKNRPDAILGVNSLISNLIEGMPAGVHRPGYAVLSGGGQKQRAGFAATNKPGTQFYEALGLLNRLIRSRSLGLPERHFDLLVHPDWHDGATLPRIGNPLPDLAVPENSIWVRAKA